MNNLKLRAATLSDLPEIQKVVKAAFLREDSDSEVNEWNLVGKFIPDKGFIPELSIVATDGERIVGHIQYTAALIYESQGVVLAPVCVDPEYQGCGIGTMLIKEGNRRAEAMGYPWISVLGDDYYLRFGFSACAADYIVIEYEHPGNPYLKILYLGDHPTPLIGKIKYCEAFYNSEGVLL